MNPIIKEVTDNIRDRSETTRRAYLNKIEAASQSDKDRTTMACSNLAHGIAACSAADKTKLQECGSLNIGIVSAYNDMLSAHQPYERFPGIIRAAAEQAGTVPRLLVVYPRCATA